MWYRAEPFSPSSWLKAQVPINRSVARTWTAIARASGPTTRAAKNRSISSGRIGVAWYRASRAISGSAYQRRNALTFSGTCRRRTTFEPSSVVGNHVRCTIRGTVYHRSMRRWSELAERLAATTRTSEKTGLLAEYLRDLTPDELPIAAVFLTGRPFAEADQRAAGLGWSAIATTVTELGGVPRAALAEAYDRYSDLGLAVEDVLKRSGHDPDPAL